MEVLNQKEMLLKYSKGQKKYNVNIQQYERVNEEVKKNNLSLTLYKNYVEENPLGVLYATELSIDPKNENDLANINNDLKRILEKKLVLLIGKEGEILNVLNQSEIRESWDENKRDFKKKHPEVNSIENRIKGINTLLQDQKLFLQYIINQELYQLIFPSFQNKEIASGKPIRSSKEYTNLFNTNKIPITNSSFLESVNPKNNTIKIYDIETINSNEFDDESLLNNYKKTYETNDIQLDHNTVRTYDLSNDGSIISTESIKKTEISDFENFEQITEIKLFPQAH